MGSSIHIVDYFNATVPNRPGEGYNLLHHLADAGVDLVAFTAVPVGDLTQLALFPREASKLTDVSRLAGLQLDGPHSAILVQGDDALGRLAELFHRLSRAGINVFAASGVADDRGGFGCLFYVGSGQQQAAVQALQH